ncbi:MAG TPA: tetratricopeptide repeat protein [Gemmatimonadales bacterium]
MPVCLLAAGCATKTQVRLLEGELRNMRIESARRDSARAATLAAMIQLQQRILDSVAAGREALRTLDVRVQSDLTSVQRQLLQVQELTGQSQTRLSEMKAQLDQRAEQAEAAGMARPASPPPGDTAARAAAPPVSAPAVPTADQIYQGARQQFNRGAVATARRGFQELLRTYPGHELVPEALFYVGESFAGEAPDSAVAYYTQVVSRYPRAAKASTALYKLGRLEEARNNGAAARGWYDRLLKEYPHADEVELARDRLKNLRP